MQIRPVQFAIASFLAMTWEKWQATLTFSTHKLEPFNTFHPLSYPEVCVIEKHKYLNK
jgi:hypothetical protein